jgi:hypothetical protein
VFCSLLGLLCGETRRIVIALSFHRNEFSSSIFPEKSNTIHHIYFVCLFLFDFIVLSVTKEVKEENSCAKESFEFSFISTSRKFHRRRLHSAYKNHSNLAVFYKSIAKLRQMVSQNDKAQLKLKSFVIEKK